MDLAYRQYVAQRGIVTSGDEHPQVIDHATKNLFRELARAALVAQSQSPCLGGMTNHLFEELTIDKEDGSYAHALEVKLEPHYEESVKGLSAKLIRVALLWSGAPAGESPRAFSDFVAVRTHVSILLDRYPHGLQAIHRFPAKVAMSEGRVGGRDGLYILFTPKPREFDRASFRIEFAGLPGGRYGISAAIQLEWS